MTQGIESVKRVKLEEQDQQAGLLKPRTEKRGIDIGGLLNGLGNNYANLTGGTIFGNKDQSSPSASSQF